MRTRGGAGQDGGSGQGTGGTGRAGRRLLRSAARLLCLLVVVLLVVAIGVGVHVPGTAPPSYSATQQAQLEAENRYRSLADDARAAAASIPDTTANPRTVELLLAVAADLEVQADAVALPRPPGASSPQTSTVGDDPSAAATPSPEATPAAPSSDGPRFLVELRDSALASLADAVDADPGPARVLASAGANQWQRALTLGAALGGDAELPVPDATTTADLAGGTGVFAGVSAEAGISTEPGAESGSEVPVPGTAGGSVALSPSTVGSSPAASTRVSAPASAPADGNAGSRECAGTPLGSDADRQALRTAGTAEDQARYGYEVAAALVEDRASLVERASTHGRAADIASDRLVALCDTPDPGAAGFALPPAFREDPLGELRRLEQQLVDLHAGQVATTGPDTRAWAIVALIAAVGRSADDGTALQPLPGIAGSSQSSVDGTPTAPTPVPEPTEDAAVPEELPGG